MEIDYKEKYEQKIKKLRGMIPNWERLSYNGKTFLQDLVYIFPELKESEDERIRKVITDIVKAQPSDSLFNGTKEKCLAWLEKQSKQKQEVEGNPNARKPTLRIVKGKSYLCIKDYRDKNCTFTKGKIYESDKDGFLVDDEEKNTFERKVWEEDAIEYFFLFEQSKTKDVITDEKQKPAFEMKTPEESLGIDSDTYSKIVDECVYDEQKPVWSKQDETLLNCCLGAINTTDYFDKYNKDEMKNWLMFLKERVQPQSHWKPSENELEVLRLAAEKDGTCLMGLYENLKKLREE